MKWRSVFLASFVAVFGFAASASAATIVGTMNINGSVQVDADTIDWLPEGGGSGTFATTLPQSGYFAAFGGGIDGAGFPDVTGVSLDLQQPTAFPVANFLSGFTSASGNLDPEYSDLTYTLTSLTAPSAPACVGGEAVNSSCSIGFFTLTQLADAVTISLNGAGYFIDPTYGESNIGTAAWSTQGVFSAATGEAINTIQGILNEIAAGGFISASYSASFTVPPDQTVVPEPATLLTFGAGSALLALRRRRKAAKAE